MAHIRTDQRVAFYVSQNFFVSFFSTPDLRLPLLAKIILHWTKSAFNEHWSVLASHIIYLLYSITIKDWPFILSNNRSLLAQIGIFGNRLKRVDIGNWNVDMGYINPWKELTNSFESVSTDYIYWRRNNCSSSGSGNCMWMKAIDSIRIDYNYRPYSNYFLHLFMVIPLHYMWICNTYINSIDDLLPLF